MGIIPKVKCSRCERSFSGLLSKCPHCGARRSKGGKFSMPEAGDPKWRLAVGVLLLVAVLCTVIALVNINGEGEDGGGGGGGSTGTGENTTEASPSPTATEGAEVSPSPDTSDVIDNSGTEASPATPSETQESIESITIKWDYYSGSNEMTIDVGFDIELKAEVYPTTADVKVTWSSENPSVCTVDENGTIKGVGSGKTTIIAEYNGVKGELIVRVK